VRLGMGCVVLCATLGFTSSAVGQKQSELPFRLIDGWAVLVQGTLGGVPNRAILIDTGAVPSAISKEMAKRLGLLGSAEQVSVMNRAIDVERVRVPKVQVGPVAADAFEMVAADLGAIEQALHARLDAVIGLDLLGRQNFAIDYRSKTLLFGRAVQSADSATFQLKHAAGGTYVLVPMESGGEKFQMLLDTGTKDFTLFRPRLKGSLRQIRLSSEDVTVNAGGSSQINKVVIPLVRLGSISRKQQDAYVWTTPEAELRDFDGMLGPTALGAIAVEFDFDRNIMILRTR
jgi:predicted aspartyl protease